MLIIALKVLFLFKSNKYIVYFSKNENVNIIKKIYIYFLKLSPLIRKNIKHTKTISLNRLIVCEIDK